MLFVNVFIHILIGLVMSWLFYFYKKKYLLGGFFGGAIIALLGGVLGNLFANYFKSVIDFLMNGMYISDLNFIATIFSAYLFLSIYNKLSHDKET